jgi:hypothetical protein
MEKIKIASKGYTLEVVSWENDGDNYNTKQVTYQDKDLAIAVATMCKELFCTQSNGKDGVGNSMDGEENKRVVDYMKEHSILTEGEKDFDEDEDDDYFYLCTEYADDLMGCSECYDFRVCESVKIFHNPENVYSEEIKF